MYAVISFEWIKSRGRPWVARITGFNLVYGLQRDFLDAVPDYSYARDLRAKRGVYLYFALPTGIYECRVWTSYHDINRFFVLADDSGDFHSITREEVNECLKSTCSVSAS